MPQLRLPALALAIVAPAIVILALVAVAASPVLAVADDDDDDRGRVDLEVLSSRADQVSGGDALVRVEASGHDRDDLRVLLNGDDVTDAFEPSGGDLVGLVDGLDLGRNRLEVVEERRGRDKTLEGVTLENHPQTGPIFSGPHQAPFVCKTIQAGLGEPLVDNQAGQGFRVLNPDGTTAGWSRNCSAQTRVDYQYRTTGGQFRALPADGSRPADMAQLRLREEDPPVDYVVRRERGTINRFIYSFAMLAPLAEAQAPQGEPDTSLWNKRLIYTFDGGVAIGRNQGTPGGSALYDIGLRQGYAIAHSSGTRTSTHYNLELGGAPGNTECVTGWRGLTPLAMNPLFGTAGAGTERMNPAVMAAVHWTHWEDVKNVYGVGPDG